MTSQSIRSCRWGRIQLRFLPMLVWIAASACVVALFYTRSARLEVPAIAEVDEHTIASTATGQLYSLPVNLYEEVKQGQTVAIVKIYTNPADETRVKADKAAAEGELQRLKAELAAAEEQLKSDAAQLEFQYSDTHRQLAVDVERNRIAMLEIRTILEPDSVLLKDYELEIRVTKDLIARGAAEEYELQKLQALYDSLAKKIEISKDQLVQAEQNLKNSEQRFAEFAQNKPAPVVQSILLDPIRKEILVQERRIIELLTERDTMVIPAPFDSVVSNIFRRPSETVLEGEPILTLAKRQPRNILAFAGRGFVTSAKDDMRVQVIKGTYPQKVYESRVLSVGPTIEQLPAKLWQSPTYPEWGRPILIAYNKEMELVPNELVWVRGL
jgi:multidrug resistance efflux pump